MLRLPGCARFWGGQLIVWSAGKSRYLRPSNALDLIPFLFFNKDFIHILKLLKRGFRLEEEVLKTFTTQIQVVPLKCHNIFIVVFL